MIKLYDHQKQGADKLWKLRVTADCSDTGVGKSFLAMELIRRRESYLNLIVTPKISFKNWEREINKFLPGSMVFILDKGSEKNLKILRDVWRAKNLCEMGVFLFVIINYESVWRLKGDPLKYFSWDSMILDEVHNIANSSKQTNYMLAYRKKDKKWKWKYKHIMSATIITNDLKSLFRPFQFLSPEILGGNYYYLREKYFYKLNDFLWVPRPNAEKDIMAKIEPYTVRFKLRDVVDMPEEIEENFDVELSKKEQEAYRQAKEDLIVELAEQKVVIVNKLVSLQKMMQISSGFLYDANKKANDIGDSKIKALKEILSGMSGKTVIFAVYQHSLHKISESIPDSIMYTGRDSEIQEFINNDDIKYFILQIGQAKSINLQKAQNAVFYELNYSQVDYTQARGRINRIGQNNRMVVVHLLASPAERLALKKVKGKMAINDSIPVTQLLKEV